MLFYVDNKTTLSPTIDNPKGKNIIIVFRELLTKLINDDKQINYNLLTGNTLTVNNGLNNNDDFSVYEITDGVNIVYSKLKKIDSNNYLIVEDISILNTNNVIIKAPKLNATYEETEVDYFFYFNREMKIRIPKISTYSFYVSNNAIENQVNGTAAALARLSGGDGWFCFFNGDTVFFGCQNNYSPPFFNSIYYANTTNNGYLEAFTLPGSGATVAPPFLAFDNINNLSYSNFTGINNGNYFFGVTKAMFSDGYISEKILSTAGMPPNAKLLEPFLINDNVIVFQSLRGGYMGLYYE